MRKAFGALGAISLLLLPIASFAAEMRGVTSTEIRIGQTMPYSGPVSAFGALGKGEAGWIDVGGKGDHGGVVSRVTGFGGEQRQAALGGKGGKAGTKNLVVGHATG